MIDKHKGRYEQNAGDAGRADEQTSGGGVIKNLRAAFAGASPLLIFGIVMLTSIIVIAAVIMYRTATESIHVKVNKVDTASVVLSGADDLGGIEAGGYASLDYRVTNESTSSAYVFIRFEMNTEGLYEIVDTDEWVEMSDIEEPGQLIFAYGEAGAMTPVGVGEEVELAGRLHCLASAEEYSLLDGTDMDFDVYGCLVYGLSEDGGGVGYNTSAESLYQAYMENGGR